ncbi:MAG: ImmA/IrrE family metallo-endopeptidase, partial [Chloroflexia bacterium]|nr:ImmA/IrrE family metallo-endopeptidase [Chloroflexia bacterium]
AQQRWAERHQRARAHYLNIVTGLETDELRALTGNLEANDQALSAWFDEPAAKDLGQHPGELLMAARMTASTLGPEQQRKLLCALKALPSVTTPGLDRLSAQAPSSLTHDEPPYVQGYQLAQWLRQQLAIPDDAPICPERYLKDWGVHLDRINMAAGIDAVAAWGARHGPAVLVNIDAHSRASTENGLRTTLAHEICHLLIDRAEALPVAEVLGGQVPRWAEQRANAFAAELLLPRAQAARACREAADLIEAATHLERAFRVSRELTMNQINNSDIGQHLSDSDKQRLARWAL